MRCGAISLLPDSPSKWDLVAHSTRGAAAVALLLAICANGLQLYGASCMSQQISDHRELRQLACDKGMITKARKNLLQQLVGTRKRRA